MITVTTTDIRAGSRVKIAYNNMFVATTIYNNCIVPLEQENTWTLPLLTIRESLDAGDASTNVDASLNATVRGIQYPKLATPKDTADSTVGATLDCQVRQIMNKTLSIPSSEASTSVSATLSATVTLVGSTPI